MTAALENQSGSQLARRVTAITATGAATFALATFAYTWLTAARRFNELAAAMPRIQSADDRISDVQGLRHQALEFGLEAPGQQVGSILTHVATLTLMFTGVVALMAVLIIYRRPGFAALAAVAATVSAALGAGPFSLIAGTVSASAVSVYGLQAPAGSSARQQASADYQNSVIAFVTPTWLRLTVALVIAAALAGIALALRRAVGRGIENPSGALLTNVLGIAYLSVVGLLGINDMSTLPSGNNDAASLIGLLACFAGLSVTAMVAGASLIRRRGSLIAVSLTALIGMAAYAMWVAHARDGGAPQVFGWVDMGSDAPLFGTALLTSALVAAVPLGWIGGRAARLVRPTEPAVEALATS